MRIVVLAGGLSSERDVSILSGSKVAHALRSKGHQVVLIDVYMGYEGDDFDADRLFAENYDFAGDAVIETEAPDIEAVKKSRKNQSAGYFGDHVLELCQAADTVFMALHGSNGEDGKIQACFELMGIPFTGSRYLGSALGMDKELTKQIFRENGVSTPAGIVLHRGDPVLPPSENGVGVPCVVKPSCGGSSVGVSIVRTEEEYHTALEEGFRYESVLIVEQYIDGREFSDGVVDGTAYPIIEIAPIQGFYDYTNKYKAGSTVETCPAALTREQTERMQKLAVDAYHALRLDSYARMDIMMAKDGGMYCLEANTLPGMTPTSLLPQEAAALGMDFGELCEKLIQVSMRGRN